MLLKGQKILVTGGAGCIGSFLVEKLCRLGNDVTIVDNLIRGPESIRNLDELYQKLGHNFTFHKTSILNQEEIEFYVNQSDYIFHLAGLPSHRRALEDPLNYDLVDGHGVVAILEAIRKSAKKPKLIFASTNKVYGDQPPPFSEDMTPRPKGPYATAKLEAEHWCQLYHQFYQLDIVIARLFHVIGPRSQPDREISIFTEQIINDQPVNIHGSFDAQGIFTSCSAGYTNIYDTVDGLILLAQESQDFSIYNIGSNQETSVEDLALAIYRHFDKTPNFVHQQMLPHESLHHCANNDKITALGWQPKYSPQDSLQQYLHWRQNIGPRESFYISNTKPEKLPPQKVYGYDPNRLLDFVKEYPDVLTILESQNFLFAVGNQIIFPDGNDQSQHLSFLRRVSLHTLSVGLTMNLLLKQLANSHHPLCQLTSESIKLATKAMMLHDIKKINEILWRKNFDHDQAYNLAGEYLSSILHFAKIPDEFIQIAGSVGHNGANNFLSSPPGSWSIIRQAAYLSDEIVQENVVQTDILAKVKRLKTDPIYTQINLTGFPDKKSNPYFTDIYGNLLPKYDIQEKATQTIASQIALCLGSDPRNLGSLIINEAQKLGIYAPPSFSQS